MGKVLFILAILVSVGASAFGQPPVPPPPNEAISLDVIVALLLISAVVYAVRNLGLNKAAVRKS